MQTAISLLVFAMMLVVGSGLVSGRDASRLAVGKTVALVVLQLTLPVMALMLGWLFELSEAVLLALVLIALCPGGTVSNFYTHLAKGSVLLSVALTTTSGVVFVALALMASLMLSPVNASMASTASGQLLFSLVLPLLAGAGLTKRYPALVNRIRPRLELAIGVGLLAVVTTLITDNYSAAGSRSVQMWLGCALFTLGAMVLGKLASMVAGLNREESVAVVLEFPCRNLALAAYLALSLSLPQEVVLMTAICFCTQLPLLAVYVATRRRLIS